MRIREKEFVQYLFTATSISKYRRRNKQAITSENKNRSRRRQILFNKQVLCEYRYTNTIIIIIIIIIITIVTISISIITVIKHTVNIQ